MKLALLLFGMSKVKNYVHWKNNKKCKIDYDVSYDNYKKYIYEYFEKKGYEIDVYFATNDMRKKHRNNLIKKYKPVNCAFIENHDNKIYSRNKKIESVVNLCLESGIKYDLVLITRFDLIFKKEFENSNIRLDKFNLVSILERPHLICDNFYLFPYKYLGAFAKIIEKNINVSFHRIQQDIYSINGPEFVNYMFDERKCIAEITFYDIVRNFCP